MNAGGPRILRKFLNSVEAVEILAVEGQRV
jgi:hypothetical protein